MGKKVLTKKDLIRLTGALPHDVSYLTSYQRLPILKESDGPGHPVLFPAEAVQVLKRYLQRKRSRQPETADSVETQGHEHAA